MLSLLQQALSPASGTDASGPSRSTGSSGKPGVSDMPGIGAMASPTQQQQSADRNLVLMHLQRLLFGDQGPASEGAWQANPHHPLHSQHQHHQHQQHQQHQHGSTSPGMTPATAGPPRSLSPALPVRFTMMPAQQPSHAPCQPTAPVPMLTQTPPGCFGHLPLFQVTNPSIPNACAACGSTTTSGCWRRGWAINEVLMAWANLCNRCGLRYKKGLLAILPDAPSIRQHSPPAPSPSFHTGIPGGYLSPYSSPPTGTSAGSGAPLAGAPASANMAQPGHCTSSLPILPVDTRSAAPPPATAQGPASGGSWDSGSSDSGTHPHAHTAPYPMSQLQQAHPYGLYFPGATHGRGCGTASPCAGDPALLSSSPGSSTPLLLTSSPESSQQQQEAGGSDGAAHQDATQHCRSADAAAPHMHMLQAAGHARGADASPLFPHAAVWPPYPGAAFSQQQQQQLVPLVRVRKPRRQSVARSSAPWQVPRAVLPGPGGYAAAAASGLPSYSHPATTLSTAAALQYGSVAQAAFEPRFTMGPYTALTAAPAPLPFPTSGATSPPLWVSPGVPDWQPAQAAPLAPMQPSGLASSGEAGDRGGGVGVVTGSSGEAGGRAGGADANMGGGVGAVTGSSGEAGGTAGGVSAIRYVAPGGTPQTPPAIAALANSNSNFNAPRMPGSFGQGVERRSWSLYSGKGIGSDLSGGTGLPAMATAATEGARKRAAEGGAGAFPEPDGAVRVAAGHGGAWGVGSHADPEGEQALQRQCSTPSPCKRPRAIPAGHAPLAGLLP